MNENSTTETFPIEDVGPAFDNEAPDYVVEEVPAPRIRMSKGATKKIHRLKDLAKAYKVAYRTVYGLIPRVTYDGKWIRLQGEAQGVSPKRLEELTRQLRARAGK